MALFGGFLAAAGLCISCVCRDDSPPRRTASSGSWSGQQHARKCQRRAAGRHLLFRPAAANPAVVRGVNSETIHPSGEAIHPAASPDFGESGGAGTEKRPQSSQAEACWECGGSPQPLVVPEAAVAAWTKRSLWLPFCHTAGEAGAAPRGAVPSVVPWKLARTSRRSAGRTIPRMAILVGSWLASPPAVFASPSSWLCRSFPDISPARIGRPEARPESGYQWPAPPPGGRRPPERLA